MLYGCLLLYVAAIYVRPVEVTPALAGIPVVDILTGLTVAVAAMALLLRPRPVTIAPTDLCMLGLWATIRSEEHTSELQSRP